MIEKLKNMMDNVIDWLIKMGECCQVPRFLDNYLLTRPEVPSYQNGELTVGGWEKELSKSGQESKAARLEEEPALSANVTSDKVLAAK